LLHDLFRYNLDLSLFERMVTAREKEYGNKAAQNGSLVTLTTQRRMRPEISNLIRVPIYPGLQDAENVMKYPDVKGITTTTNMQNDNEKENENKNELSYSYITSILLFSSLCTLPTVPVFSFISSTTL
jgi:hypothetical protein